MDDPTGLSKVLETEIARSVYKEGLSGATRETGNALTDAAKAVRLFLAPIQLLAAAQDRFARWLTRITSEVPEERQVEAPANIAGPAIQALLFLDEEDALAEMYLNLLRRAIDKEEQHRAHPAFVRIIEQLSPDEALVLYFVGNGPPFLYVDLQSFMSSDISKWQWWIGGKDENGKADKTEFVMGALRYPGKLWMYLEHLASLNLVNRYGHEYELEIGESWQWAFQRSQFGDEFVQACLPKVVPFMEKLFGMSCPDDEQQEQS